jgi:hypothetical protein
MRVAEHLARSAQFRARLGQAPGLDLRAAREQRIDDVVDAQGTKRGTVETGHARPLMTVFGEVDVTRRAYRQRGEDNLYPADAALNLPVELQSHGLREIAAVESARGSFEEAAEALRRATGAHCGKRQVEQLAARAPRSTSPLTQPSRCGPSR